VYFNSVSISILDGRGVPAEKDIDEAFKEVSADKQMADKDFKASTKNLVDDPESENIGL
jgi:hypothetical protein